MDLQLISLIRKAEKNYDNCPVPVTAPIPLYFILTDLDPRGTKGLIFIILFVRYFAGATQQSLVHTNKALEREMRY